MLEPNLDLRRAAPGAPPPLWPAPVLLAGVLALVHQYRLLDRRFELLLLVLSAGFVVHVLLPFRWKQPFFLALSVLSGLALLPPEAVALLVLAAVLFHLICVRVPAGAPRRAALAAFALAAVLARARGWDGGAGPRAWTLVCVFFLFRGWLYARDRAPSDESLLDALTYLLVSPAFYFLVFPALDYRLFRRCYFARPQAETALAGAHWMLRGAFQLLAYRLVLWALYRDPAAIASPGGLLLFSICAFASLVKITGCYHLSIGLLQLYGFDLPRPANNYFLARSFLDHWSRSNIYWKNLLLKTAYLPLFLRLQGLGRRRAAVLAGAATFAATWALHGAQRFAVLGEPRFTLVDGVFWAVMGGGAIVSLASGTAGEERPWTPLDALRVAGVFVAQALMWGLASMPSLGAWWALVRRCL